jgi:hypothetical protein
MDRKRKKTFLSDEDWKVVFRLRCAVKRKYVLSEREARLCRRAWEEDMKRYEEMEQQVEEEISRMPPVNRGEGV